ncbi:MAG: insulinase family protein, partial [Lysobacteraceae bacterium]
GLAGILMASGAQAATAGADDWRLPIVVKTLDNGLTVVVSEDHSSPTVGVSVVYRVGFRSEPRNRSGFAHLFEHLMFEGSPNAPVGVFDRVITGGGGDNNGSTHPDFTNYIEQAPVSALEPILWLEADRMKTLNFSQKTLDNQRDVVKEEIRVNVKNQPYGGFAWTDLPMLAFAKWENSHDGYGSFTDLEHAKLEDVRAFHRDFYGPNNAVIGISGDITPAQAFALAQKYFGGIPRRATPARADISEPLNAAEKRKLQGDTLARLPALAVGWKMPARGTADHVPMVMLSELLAGGDASRLYQRLVKGDALVVQLDSFIGAGSPWEFDGPSLFTLQAVYKYEATADQLLLAIDQEIASVADQGVDDARLQSLKTRMLADWYDGLEGFMDRADTLANLQAIWGDANIANRIPEWIDGVTWADLQRVTRTYLTHANRSEIDRRPDAPLAPEQIDHETPVKPVLKSKTISPAAMKAEVTKAQAAKANAAKQVEIKTISPAAMKAEVEKAEAAKADAPKARTSKIESSKPKSAKAEAVKADAEKADAVKSNAAKANVLNAKPVASAAPAGMTQATKSTDTADKAAPPISGASKSTPPASKPSSPVTGKPAVAAAVPASTTVPTQTPAAATQGSAGKQANLQQAAQPAEEANKLDSAEKTKAKSADPNKLDSKQDKSKKADTKKHDATEDDSPIIDPASSDPTHGPAP